MNKKNSPLITIFTLSFNSPDLFGAIDSVLTQDYENIEYIILDDCSDNFDSEEIEKYINSQQKGNISRIIVEKNDKRAGIVAQTNKALRYSTGEYIFNLAGDDQFYDGKVISDWVNEFQKTGADVITAYREIYDENLTTPIRVLPKQKDVNAIKTLTPSQLFEYIEGCNVIFGSSTARSKRAINELGPIDEKYKTVEDYVMVLRHLRKNKPVAFFDRKVIKYREGGVCAADHINKEYLKESDEIFNCEILPFTANKKLAKKKYIYWRKGTVLGQIAKKAKTKHNPIYFFFACMGYGLIHPIFMVKKIIQKSRNRKEI